MATRSGTEWWLVKIGLRRLVTMSKWSTETALNIEAMCNNMDKAERPKSGCQFCDEKSAV